MREYIIPRWNAPKNVKAYSTTRLGGFSLAPYSSFNLGDHSGDDPIAVEQNRQMLRQDLNLGREPKWLKQIHGTTIIDVQDWKPGTQADGSYSRQQRQPCIVMTADCLPILLCDEAGTQVMALHGGWRGLASRIIQQGAALFKCEPHKISAWLGPSIGPEKFEVGEDVKMAFLSLSLELAPAFRPLSEGKYLMDIYAVASMQLRDAGVQQIYSENRCTHTESETFFSYRRDGVTGRMASIIVLE